MTSSRLSGALSLWRVLRPLSREIAAHERDLVAPLGLSPAQAQALLELAEAGPLGMNDLADQLCIARSTTTRLVDQMESKGWVRRVGDPADRRRVLLELRPEGEGYARRLDECGLQRCWEMMGRSGLQGGAMAALEALTAALHAGRAQAAANESES